MRRLLAWFTMMLISADLGFAQGQLIPSASVIDNSVKSYSIPDHGGLSVTTDGGSPDNIDVGFSRIIPDAGSMTPAGVAIFGFRVNGVLVSEAGVVASSLLQTGRIYVEVNGPINTGVAIANPNSQAATVSFSFTQADGTDFGLGSLTIPAHGQRAAFLNQPPFNVGSIVQGTMTFRSNVPISVITLRGFTNERGEFLITTLPVLDTSAPAGVGTAVLPHFADGGGITGSGWTTSVILINPTDSAMSGTVQFLDGTGASTELTVAGTTSDTFSYSLPRRSSFKLVTAGGVGPTIRSGSVWISPFPGNGTPTSLALFSYKPEVFTISEAGVPSNAGTAFRMYAETSSSGAAGSIQTGIAVTNSSGSAASVTFELFKLDGTSALLAPVSISVPGAGQNAKFLNEIFPTLASPFRGVLRTTTNSPGIAVVGLRGRYNERGDFLITTTPSANEGAASTSAELNFPHIVNGGGYTTQFVLFSGTAGQNASGSLHFLKQDGTSFQLDVE